MSKDIISHPPLEDSGKSLISTVIYLLSESCETNCGMGGCKGKAANTTPNMGDFE